ncbi:SH3 domain-containing protein [Aurantiacibacter spongiae]|uniref:SH3b domain-containing protein n=1 Tax=Aurantiacibacter spongiae TaxID=2488860 RepID=A0A3N5CP79_9SPHN|nr:SH3 domain-containing protein [Aurantiacibacter spongiae]RPF70387.1 hypothetical protein EG799_01135 [Aurantiacibacter spongiae]
MSRIIASMIAGLAAMLCAPAAAQEDDLPYWASIDTQEANMRVGAGEKFPISWVYHAEGLPVKVIRFNQGWRYVEEPDGTQGWISASLLSRDRGAIVTGEGTTDIRAEPTGSSRLMWKVEPGVIGALGECENGWCEFEVNGRRGWVDSDRLWGDGDP